MLPVLDSFLFFAGNGDEGAFYFGRLWDVEIEQFC